MQDRLNMADEISLDLSHGPSCLDGKTDHMLHVTCIQIAFCRFCFTLENCTQQTSRTSHNAGALLRFVKQTSQILIHAHVRHN